MVSRTGNYSGYIDPASIDGWHHGLIDVDWSNAKAQWVEQQPMNDEAMLLEQFQRLKKADPHNKVWLYRGTIYAYPWYKETRLILDDPAYEPWFLHFVRLVAGAQQTATYMCKCTRLLYVYGGALSTPLRQCAVPS
jgi:hypothetical protein